MENENPGGSLQSQKRVIEDPRRQDIFQDASTEAKGVDVIFSNGAAVSKFVQFLSSYTPDEESVLSLARANARITASTVLLTLPDGKGRKRNSKLKQS